MVSPSVFNAVVYLKADAATIATRLRTLATNAASDPGVENADAQALDKVADDAEKGAAALSEFATKYGIG